MKARRAIYIPRIECPLCGSPKFKTERTSTDPDDGEKVRYTRCRECGARYDVIVVSPTNLPNSGNGQLAGG